MATYDTRLVLSNSTDAQFRAWGSAIGARLAAFGWVRTADAGQIDWDTVLAPGGAVTMRGYEMWRMNDALQATAPVFMRLAYGSGLNFTSALALEVSFGTSTNGAGVLLGHTTPVHLLRNSVLFGGGTPDANGAYRCVFSGDTSRFAMCLGMDSNPNGNSHLLLVVERSKDNAGSDSPLGVGCVISGGSTRSRSVFLPFAGPSPGGWDVTHGVVSITATSGVRGADVSVIPIYPVERAAVLNPYRGIVGYFNADVNVGTVAQVPIYGANQPMLFLGLAASHRTAVAGLTAEAPDAYAPSGYISIGPNPAAYPTCAAIRWE